MKLSRNYEKLYQEHHERKPKHFSGKMSAEQVREIAALVNLVKPDRILDYGSGKGYQYIQRRLHEQWGGLLPYCYDPGVIQISKMPEGLFCGVICTDVMEHIAPEDVDTILDDIFSKLYPDRYVFAYFHISTRPAGKTFMDGENVHLTVQPPEWWDAKLERFRDDGRLHLRATYGF